MNIVILAAGQGKRMHSDRAKVLHPLAGRPLLSHVLEAALQLEPESICVVYGHGGEAVRHAFADPEGRIVWARQEPQLGTGHALMQALPFLGNSRSTLVLYGDVPLIQPQTLRRLGEAAAADALAVLTAEPQEPSGYGRIIRHGAGGTIARIVEEKDASAAERAVREVNTGIMVLPTVRLKAWLGRLGNHNAQKEYYLTDVVALAADDGLPVHAVQAAAEWETLGINSRAQLARLERIYQGRLAERLLDEGVALADPARIDIRGSLRAGRDCSIDVNCVFEGDVVLGEGVSIGPNCVIRNAAIADSTRIEAFCHIDEAKIGERCRIGPYARLRPATALAEDVHIGNFVEVKASQLGTGTKANHLAYIGDSSVGKNVNVGAGTITCNYDGANKYRTIIEDDVFIGSDTQLIAPIRVGRGATLAAGTTLAKDAPEGMLTLSRIEQKSVRWNRPVKKAKT